MTTRIYLTDRDRQPVAEFDFEGFGDLPDAFETDLGIFIIDLFYNAATRLPKATARYFRANIEKVLIG